MELSGQTAGATSLTRPRRVSNAGIINCMIENIPRRQWKMDSSMMDAFKALNKTEKKTPGAEAALLEIKMKLDGSLNEMRELISEAKKTLDSSTAVLMTVSLLLVEIKAIAENSNRLYISDDRSR
jgi:hypothetical protein